MVDPTVLPVIRIERPNELLDLRAQNDRLVVLLERWLNIAVHGTYGDRTKFSLKSHPLTDETREYLKSVNT